MTPGAVLFYVLTIAALLMVVLATMTFSAMAGTIRAQQEEAKRQHRCLMRLVGAVERIRPYARYIVFAHQREIYGDTDVEWKCETCRNLVDGILCKKAVADVCIENGFKYHEAKVVTELEPEPCQCDTCRSRLRIRRVINGEILIDIGLREMIDVAKLGSELCPYGPIEVEVELPTDRPCRVDPCGSGPAYSKPDDEPLDLDVERYDE